MSRTFGCRFVLLVVLWATYVVPSNIGVASGAERLVSEELLSHAGLKIIWESDLPMRKAENLEQLLLLGDRVYAISDRNYMTSLNKDSGKTIFARVFAPAGVPIVGLKLYGDELLSVGGSKLVQSDAESGDELRSMDVGFGITCPAARNSSYFYVAGTDNRLHAYRADDRVQTFEVAAKDESAITSVTADDNLVIFATAKGNVLGVAPDAPRLLWQFDAAEGIAGPVVKDFMSLFFASADTNVYRVDIVGLPEMKRLVWKYQAAAVLERAPRVTQEVVYQHVHGKGVTAIDKETGSLLWRVPGGVDLLVEARGRAYVITKAEKLVVMDNTKAKRLYSVNFGGVTVYASNTGDEKLYIADKRGRVMCLQPAE
ncbi:MAG: outer membrane protein assembly factor BamB family protein [Planctomycetota bacterium]